VEAQDGRKLRSEVGVVLYRGHPLLHDAPEQSAFFDSSVPRTKHGRYRYEPYPFDSVGDDDCQEYGKCHPDHPKTRGNLWQ